MSSQNRSLVVIVMMNIALLGPSVAGQMWSEASARDKFVGAKRLVSIETIRPNGEVIYPFYGKHPEGLIMYDNSGWMSVQVVSDPSANAPSRSSREEVMAAPSAEKSSAFDSYYTYCGTWSLDTAQQVVRHHIRQALIPGEVGEEVVRRYVLDGDRLTLTAKTHEMGEDHERKLVWQRLPKQPATK
jgi:lipocalin-like protein